ncbi:hypothetical protein H6P81_016794 [Aristolochia fimbriata]|uniref:Uncharacterized protein n=1 Tax=Aristolochia fimbriata TaxID=158543 RepID=A0AAV7E9Z9_ARIFI|nr:hypothetical protein H6P81_016794 [Aristolochia fimbriata]
MEEAPPLSENHAKKPTPTNTGTEPAAETQKPPQPTETAAAVPPCSNLQKTKKRKVDNGDDRNFTFFKIRKIVKDLRPHFVEVMCSPNFQESKAADEIRKQMQNMMELTKQLQLELKEMENSKKPTQDQQCTAGESNPELVEKKQEDKQVHPSSPDKSTEKPNKEPKDQAPGAAQKTHVIGSSSLGWNFTMLPGAFPVYYGESKARFLARQAVKSVKD